MTWLGFALALLSFFVLHAVPVQPPVKAWISARIGARGFSILYSVISTLMLIWILVAAARAPEVMLWPKAIWQYHLALTLMAVASMLLALAIARPNPLSFGGANNDRFHPEQAGIIGWLRHPLLAVIGIWAAVHLLMNGDLAHLIVFGLFLGFAFAGMKMIDRRKRRQMGEEWVRLAATKRAISLTREGVLRAGIGLGLYVILLALHPLVIGVSPLP